MNRTRAPEDGFQPPSIVAAAKGGDATEKSPLAKNDHGSQAVSGDEAIDGKSKRNYKEFNAEERWRRIVMNDIENIIIGIVLHWISFIANTNKQGSYTVTAISFMVFTIARISHTICYIWRLQPWRSIVWLIGVLCSLTASINILVVVL